MAVRGVSEKAFTAQVKHLARLCGYLPYHTWRSVHSDAGFPDLVLCRADPPRLLFAELKVGRGKLSPPQERWRDTLLAAGQEWHEWRPDDLERIAEILRAA